MAQGKQKKPTVDEVISKAVIATRLSCARETGMEQWIAGGSKHGAGQAKETNSR